MASPTHTSATDDDAQLRVVSDITPSNLKTSRPQEEESRTNVPGTQSKETRQPNWHHGQNSEGQGELKDLWGSSSWCPVKIQRPRQPDVLEAMIAVTRDAMKCGIVLDTLWDSDGPLTKAMAELRRRRLTVDVCKRAQEHLRRLTENHGSGEKRAAVNGTFMKECNNEETIEVAQPKSIHEPTTMQRFQFVQQGGLGEMDDWIGDLNDDTDDDLPSLLELAEGGANSRKRKKCNSVIDFSGEISSPEPACVAGRPTKRPRDKMAPTADEVFSQLQLKVQMNDAVLGFISQVLFARFWARQTEKKAARVLDSLWFGADDETLPQKLPSFEKYVKNFFPIYHRGLRHWTLGVLETTEHAVRFDLYDSQSNPLSATRANARLKAWLQKYGLLRTVDFQRKECAQQDDAISCGIFVLIHLRRLLTGEATNEPINPMEARKQLLSDLLQEDASSLPSLATSNLSLLREVQELGIRETQIQDTAPDLGQSVTSAQPLVEGDAHSIPSALVNFVKKVMTFGSLDQLRSQLSVEENSAEQARSDLQKAKTAHESAVTEVTLTREIYANTVALMEDGPEAFDVEKSFSRDGKGKQDNGIDDVWCLGQVDPIESRIVSLRDEYSNVITMKAKKDIRDKLSRRRLQEVEAVETRAQEWREQVAMHSREVEEREKQVTFLRHSVPMLELVLELENGSFRDFL